MGNPFAERAPYKKRVVNVSMTQDQFEAFIKLQTELGYSSSGAFIKALLSAEVERQVEFNNGA